MRRGRKAIAGAVALLLAIVPAAAAGGAPTAAHIKRATDRFLDARSAPRASTAALPRATGDVFPANRVVAFYGAPQMGQTVLGMNSPAAAAKKLAAQSRPYGSLGSRPVLGEFDLVSVFATAGGGSDGMYRVHQSPEIFEIYLAQARSSGLRLMLDV